MNNSKERALACVVCYDTDESTRITLNKIPPERNFDVLIVNDGSVDRTREYVEESGFKAIHHETNMGLGAAIKAGVRYALDNGYEIFVIMAGNNKDDPCQASSLIKPIIEEDIDFVQGSRFIEGGSFENPPFIRCMLVKLYIWLFKLMTGFSGTDAINGFRAYKLSIFNDPRINIWQDWLNGYGYETYLYYKVLKLGYKIKEVPVTKSYSNCHKKIKYSHVKPIVDWWGIIKPIIYLKLRIKG